MIPKKTRPGSTARRIVDSVGRLAPFVGGAPSFSAVAPAVVSSAMSVSFLRRFFIPLQVSRPVRTFAYTSYYRHRVAAAPAQRGQPVPVLDLIASVRGTRTRFSPSRIRDRPANGCPP